MGRRALIQLLNLACTINVLVYCWDANKVALEQVKGISGQARSPSLTELIC